jgi:hypothetical protein
VKQASRDSLWLRRFFGFHCNDCGSESGLRSRPRTFVERYFLPILLLQPVRCAECFRRDYRLILTPVKERTPETLQELRATEQKSKSNVA